MARLFAEDQQTSIAITAEYQQQRSRRISRDEAFVNPTASQVVVIVVGRSFLVIPGGDDEKCDILWQADSRRKDWQADAEGHAILPMPVTPDLSISYTAPLQAAVRFTRSKGTRRQSSYVCMYQGSGVQSQGMRKGFQRQKETNSCVHGGGADDRMYTSVEFYYKK